jgi:drug/metabolite transporter (DMT)-like permease
LALAAAVAFALANTSAGLAYRSGSTPLTVAAIRFLLPTIALLVWLRVSGVRMRPLGRDGWIAGLLGVITGVYTLALLHAIGSIPIALAVLVFYLFPLIATIILAICGWEKFGWPTITAVVLAFAGLALALDPSERSFHIEGVALAVGAAMGLGLVIAVSSRVFRSGDSRPVTLYMAATAAALLVVLCVVNGEFVLPKTGVGWLGFFGTSVFYAFAMIAFFIAISMIGPVRAALLSYVEPVVTAGLGLLLFGEMLAPIQIAGIALVIGALVGSTLWPRSPSKNGG